jgi:methionyl-tRNA formyltransferase
MNAVLIGSVSSSAAALRGMLRGGLPVVGVCGLHECYADTVSDYYSLGPLAKQAGFPFIAFDKVTEPQVRDLLESQRPDWLFVIGLSQLVPIELRQIARIGAVGFHPTPLPEGRGRAPVAWTILKQRQAAANLFYLTDEPDAGDIIGQRPVPVYQDDYAGDLIARTNMVFEQMVADLSPAFVVGNVPRTPQDHSKATYYERRRPEDGKIDWTDSADDIYRLVRAVSHPYPGAFTFMGNKKILIWRARPILGKGDEVSAGRILADENGQPIVQTGHGLLALQEIEYIGEQRPVFHVGSRLGNKNEWEII